MDPAVLAAILGITTTIALGLAAWSLNNTVNLKSEVQSLKAVNLVQKEEIDRRFNETREESNRRFLQMETSTKQSFDELKIDLREIHTSVTAVHKRLDAIRDKH